MLDRGAGGDKNAYRVSLFRISPFSAHSLTQGVPSLIEDNLVMSDIMLVLPMAQ